MRGTRVTRAVAAALAITLVLGACGNGSDDSPDASQSPSTTKGPRRDEAGHVIKEGEDWSSVGNDTTVRGAGTGTNGEGQPASGSPGSAANDSDAAQRALDCGLPPPTTAYTGSTVPGADMEHPFGRPDNDFPIRFTVEPGRADAGDHVRMEVVAVGKPNALIVILARFYDGHHHGMRAAKFADTTGKAVFDGLIPADAPLGSALINASASTSDEQSAIASQDFVVTGPGCP